MLDLINADRIEGRLSPVQWDDFAGQVAQAHAEDMATNLYMSHWNLAGEGPDIRYGCAGGTEWVQENVYMYWYRYNDGSPAPIEKWETVIREAQVSLMNSPGHRANIMAPAHTHAGVGIAYNASTGDMRIAQEFINRYVTLESLPRQASVDETVTVVGQLLPGASNPVINLAYEPFLQPLTVAEVEARQTYNSPAVFFAVVEPHIGAAGRFQANAALDYESRPGIYHIRIWVDVDQVQVQATDIIINVTTEE